MFRERKIIELREERGMFYHRFRSKENFLAYSKEMKEHPEKMFEQPLISIPEEKLRLMAEKLKEEIAKNNNAIELE